MLNGVPLAVGRNEHKATTRYAIRNLVFFNGVQLVLRTWRLQLRQNRRDPKQNQAQTNSKAVPPMSKRRHPLSALASAFVQFQEMKPVLTQVIPTLPEKRKRRTSLIKKDCMYMICGRYHYFMNGNLLLLVSTCILLHQHWFFCAGS